MQLWFNSAYVSLDYHMPCVVDVTADLVIFAVAVCHRSLAWTPCTALHYPPSNSLLTHSSNYLLLFSAHIFISPVTPLNNVCVAFLHLLPSSLSCQPPSVLLSAEFLSSRPPWWQQK